MSIVELAPLSMPRAIPAPHASSRVRIRIDGKGFGQAGHKLRIQGVTYGPFAPGPSGDQFPKRSTAAHDFARMRAAGFNAIRTYHLPPDWLFEAAAQHDVLVFVDVPWRKHVCFDE